VGCGVGGHFNLGLHTVRHKAKKTVEVQRATERGHIRERRENLCLNPGCCSAPGPPIPQYFSGTDLSVHSTTDYIYYHSFTKARVKRKDPSPRDLEDTGRRPSQRKMPDLMDCQGGPLTSNF